MRMRNLSPCRGQYSWGESSLQSTTAGNWRISCSFFLPLPYFWPLCSTSWKRGSFHFCKIPEHMDHQILCKIRKRDGVIIMRFNVNGIRHWSSWKRVRADDRSLYCINGVRYLAKMSSELACTDRGRSRKSEVDRSNTLLSAGLGKQRSICWSGHSQTGASLIFNPSPHLSIKLPVT